MIAAIVGKAGSGKTTIGQALSSAGYLVLTVDDLVRKCFSDMKLTSKSGKPITAYKEMAEYLLDDIEREYIENKIFRFLWPIIVHTHVTRKEYCMHNSKSQSTVYVDGILPRFADLFDQVIHVSRYDKTQREILESRGGHTKKTIDLICTLQKDWK